MRQGRRKYTVLLDGAHQVDVWADNWEYTEDGEHLHFENDIPGQDDFSDIVAVFVCANIMGFIRVE